EMRYARQGVVTLDLLRQLLLAAGNIGQRSNVGVVLLLKLSRCCGSAARGEPKGGNCGVGVAAPGVACQVTQLVAQLQPSVEKIRRALDGAGDVAFFGCRERAIAIVIDAGQNARRRPDGLDVGPG